MLASRRVKLAALAAGMTLMAGCGIHPGAAAVVGSDTISQDEVDDVAQAVCAANLATAKAQNQPLPRLATRGAREVALQMLLDAELSHQFAETKNVQANPQEVSQALASNESGFALLPAKEREDLRNALRGYVEGQLMLVEIGKQSLGQDVSQDEAIAEGSRLRDQYVKDLDIEVDPRYGSFERGALRRDDEALSVAQSEMARAGDKAQPDQGFVESLPASQKCR